MTMSAPASIARPAELLLPAERRRGVLDAPVRHDDDDVGAGLRARRRCRLERLDGHRARCPGVSGAASRRARWCRSPAGRPSRRRPRGAPPCAPPSCCAGAACAMSCLSRFVDRLEDPEAAGIADVVVGQRDPVDAGVLERPRCRRGWPRRPSPTRGTAKSFGAGFSKLAMATSAPLNRSRTAPALPARFVYGVSQPKGEQFLQVPVMSAVPPLNGKSTPRRGLDRELDAAVEQDVAARDHRPGLLRVVGAAPAPAAPAASRGAARPRAT